MVSLQEGPASVLASLDRNADLTRCRNGLNQLNASLDRQPDLRPPPLGDAEKKLLQESFGLAADELAEIGSQSFTRLDAHYLDQCLCLREAVASLGLEGKPPREQAAAIFDWAMRAVALNEGSVDGAASEVVCPPVYTLRRGWGSALERTLVFLAALEQAGIPGCMIGIAEGEQPHAWIPGALADGQVSLFDPRLGAPLPGPDGASIATLAQLRTHPGRILSALEFPGEPPYDLTERQAPRAEILAACSLSALSPRMRIIHDTMAVQQPLRCAIEPGKLLEQFASASQGERELPIRVWNQGPCLLRCLRDFLPATEGGRCSASASLPGLSGAQQAWLESVVPWERLPPLEGEMRTRLAPILSQPFLRMAAATGPTPTRQGAGARMAVNCPNCGALTQLNAQSVEGSIQCERCGLPFMAMEGRPVAGRSEVRDRFLQLLTGTREMAARGRLDEALQNLSEALDRGRMLVAAEEARMRAARGKGEPPSQEDQAFALAVHASTWEIAYLAAMIRHERAARGNDPAAWERCERAWRQFLLQFPESAEAPAGRQLLARALDALGQPDEARAVLTPVPGMGPWARRAFLHQARQLQPASEP